MRLTGRVTSGIGKGAQFVALPWVGVWLKASFDLVPQPGTLNLELDLPVPEEWLRRRASDGLLLPPASDDYCASRWFRVRIEHGDRSADGVVVVPEVPGYRAQQLEIVAAHHLRSRLDLSDGMPVMVELIH